MRLRTRGCSARMIATISSSTRIVCAGVRGSPSIAIRGWLEVLGHHVKRPKLRASDRAQLRGGCSSRRTRCCTGTAGSCGAGGPIPSRPVKCTPFAPVENAPLCSSAFLAMLAGEAGRSGSVRSREFCLVVPRRAAEVMAAATISSPKIYPHELLGETRPLARYDRLIA